VTADIRRTRDPEGREVVFDAATHLHLVEAGRGWLVERVDLILATVERPDHRENDPRAGRERFYRQNALRPGRWLRVIVDFNVIPASIITAFVQDNDPREQQR
jgi:hypothetical protein